MRQTASAEISKCQPSKKKVRAPSTVAYVSTFHVRLIPSTCHVKHCAAITDRATSWSDALAWRKDSTEQNYVAIASNVAARATSSTNIPINPAANTARFLLNALRLRERQDER